MAAIAQLATPAFGLARLAIPPVTPMTGTDAMLLEERLGDAFAPNNRLGVWAKFPTGHAGTPLDEACRQAGLHLGILPPEHGGHLTDLAELMLTVRTAARRDPNVMPQTLISVTALSLALVADDPAAVARISAAIRRGETVGFAMSEEATGSDILAGAARLHEAPEGGLVLSGRKWMMGGGQACRSAVVIAAHAGRRGPGAFSAVLVDLPEGAVEDPVPTVGMSRCQFANLELDGLRVSAADVIGTPLRGLELAMRAQQLVRTMSTIASVSCIDTGFRFAVRHLDRLRLARTPGRPSVDDPTPAAMLGACAVELVLADVITQTAARLVHVAPQAAGLGSAVVKELAPILGRRALRGATDLLGARGVIATGPGGVLARLQADNEVVRYIDLSVAANQRVVAMYLSTYGVAQVEDITDGGETPSAITDLFSLPQSLPPLDLTRLALRPRPDDPVVLALAKSCAEAAAVLHLDDSAEHEEVAELVSWVWDAVRDELLSLAEQRVDGAGAVTGEAISRFGWLWSAACCVHLWLANRSQPLYGGDPGWTGWLRDCLQYVRIEVGGDVSGHAAQAYSATMVRVRDLVRTAQAVTALPHPLADTPTVVAPDEA